MGRGVKEAKSFNRSQAGTVPGSPLFAIQDLYLVATTGQASCLSVSAPLPSLGMGH